MADFVISKVEESLFPESEEATKESCPYMSGESIQLPTWFLRVQGHRLEEVIKNIFQELKRFQREGQLKYEILSKVVDDVPVLLPKDFIPLFHEIQNVYY
jgi:hypothetical protein